MRDAILLLFGAVLSMIGGFLNQNYQNQNQIKKQDRENLFKALKQLIELKSILKNQSYANQHPAIIKPREDLLQYSCRIQTRKYRKLAFKLVDFAKKRERPEEEEVIDLIEKVSEKISKPLDMFHKQENKLFKNAMNEIQHDYERGK